MNQPVTVFSLNPSGAFVNKEEYDRLLVENEKYRNRLHDLELLDENPPFEIKIQLVQNPDKMTNDEIIFFKDFDYHKILSLSIIDLPEYKFLAALPSLFPADILPIVLS